MNAVRFFIALRQIRCDVRQRTGNVLILLPDRRNVMKCAARGFLALEARDDPCGQVLRSKTAACRCDVTSSEERLIEDFDACLDYKSADWGRRLFEEAPKGVDLYFDNVGGSITDIVLLDIAMHGRVVLCGAISQYSDMGNVRGPRNYLKLAERNSRMEGFNVTRFGARFAEAESALSEWLATGRLRVHEHVEEGIENFPRALELLFTGGHHGKLLLRV